MSKENEVIKYAKKNKEGFTALYKDGKMIPVKGNQKERYSVADKTAIIYIPKEKNVRYYSPIKNNTYVGGWYDKDTGKYLIENIDLYSNRQRALNVARKRKQKAIFDLIKMNEIKLQYRERVTGIRLKPTSKDVVIIKKGKYFNRLTGKYTTEDTANRLNRFFRKNPNATLYEAHSQPFYKQKEKWEKQSGKIVDLYKRRTQVIKTKDRFGNDVYYSPILKKRVTKKQMKAIQKYDFMVGEFHVSLYRMTVDKGRIYHTIKSHIGRTFEEQEDIDRLEKRFSRSWIPEAMKIVREVAKKYPLHGSQVMYVAFSHEFYLVNYGHNEQGAVTVMKSRQPHRHLDQFPGEIHRAFNTYRALLNTYRIITVKDVAIYIYSFPTEETRAISENRLGVFKRNGVKSD
jgi:hypothetical protein